MAALLILSVDPGTGKTAVGAGLAKRLISAGKKVAFVKPALNGADGDAAFMKQALGLPDAAETMTPPLDQLKQAYIQLSPARDFVLIEGLINDANSTQIYRELAQNGRVILVEVYHSSHPEVYQSLAPNLMGVIINKVPRSQAKKVRESEAARLKSAGVNLLGLVPEDRALLAPSVAELAASLQGKILNSTKKSDRLVENIMLGAMCVDSGVLYYSRKPAKAAVLRADRPDMQLAALETDTACLVLAGSTSPPIHSVAFKAESRGIPLIATEKSVNEIITSVEDILERSKFAEARKLPRLTEVMQQNVELPIILGALGVVG